MSSHALYRFCVSTPPLAPKPAGTGDTGCCRNCTLPCRQPRQGWRDDSSTVIQPWETSLHTVDRILRKQSSLHKQNNITRPPDTIFSVPLHQLISALDKMAAISQATFSSTFSWMRTLEFRFNFRIFFSPKSPIDNRSALVQVMARRLFGAKPLPETMLTQFTDVNTGHWVGWVKPSSKRCDMS